jgi:hypothetical protein
MIRSCLILKNETDSTASVNIRSEKISEKIQPAGPSGQVWPKPVRPRSFPVRPPLEPKRLARYFCARKLAKARTAAGWCDPAGRRRARLSKRTIDLNNDIAVDASGAGTVKIANRGNVNNSIGDIGRLAGSTG